MGQSILVFVSHSSEDKKEYIEPIVQNIEDCYINVWIDKRKIVPGENLRKSIFRDGLDKADIVLLFFTEKSLKSLWVDKEIKHVLREESKKGNNFDLNKIISIFDSQETYDEISDRYPELTDDLLHLMPKEYNKIQLGQLITAIWSKYLSLQGGDIEVQKQLLEKDKESFQKDKIIEELKSNLKEIKNKNSKSNLYEEFESIVNLRELDDFIQNKDQYLTSAYFPQHMSLSTARTFNLVEPYEHNSQVLTISSKGREFFQWYLLHYQGNMKS